MSKILRYRPILASLAIISMVAFVLPTGTYAATDNSKIVGNGDPAILVCNVLASLGMGCGGTPYKSNTSNTGNGSDINNDGGVVAGASTSDSNSNSNLTASIAAGSYNNGETTLVNVSGSQEIYEITKGQKHLIPNMDIFYNYGFKLEAVQPISLNDLNRYQRVKLVRVSGNKQVYYLTEGGMTRPVPGQEVFDSYGDREQDIIDISKKEFNFYPVNQFVFLEMPLNRDVFQIVNGTKRYLTPMAVMRMKLNESEIAPVNQTEVNFYKTGTPIIY